MSPYLLLGRHILISWFYLTPYFNLLKPNFNSLTPHCNFLSPYLLLRRHILIPCFHIKKSKYLQDHRGNQLYVGINNNGILTFQASKKTHHFKWSEVQKINFEGRMFIVHLNYPEVSKEWYRYFLPSKPCRCFFFQNRMLYNKTVSFIKIK